MRDYVQLHAVVLLWGFTAILGRLIHVPPAELVVLRTGLAAAGFAVLARALRQPVWVGGKPGLILFATGFLVGMHWILFFAATQWANASICLAGLPSTTLFCAFLEPLLIPGKRLRWHELAVGLTLIPALWLIMHVEVQFSFGLWLSVGSAFAGSVFAVLNGKLAKEHHFAVISCHQMAGASVFALMALPLFPTPIVSPTAADWFWLAILAFVCTVGAYGAYMELLRRMSVFVLNVTYNLEPVYGIVLAALIFREDLQLTLGFYLGSLLIVASVMAVPFFRRLEGR